MFLQTMEYIEKLKRSPELFREEEAAKYSLCARYFKSAQIGGCTLTLSESFQDFDLHEYLAKNKIQLPAILGFFDFFTGQGIEKERYLYTFYNGYSEFQEEIHLPCIKGKFTLIPGMLELERAELFVISGKSSLSAGISGQIFVGSCALELTAAYEEETADIIVRACEGKFPGFLELAAFVMGNQLSEDICAHIQKASETIFDLSVSGMDAAFHIGRKELLYAAIAGVLRLGPFRILIKAALPRMELFGELDPDAELTVKAVLEGFGCKNADLFKDLYLTTGSYHGDFHDGRHEVKIAVEGALALGPICLEKLCFLIAWNSENEVSWKIGGVLKICEGLELSAEVTSNQAGIAVWGSVDFAGTDGKNGFWHFLSDGLGVGQLPKWLTNLELYRFSVSYDTAKERLELGLSGGLMICGAEKLLISTSLLMERQSAKKTVNIQSVMYLGCRQFQLSYEGEKLCAVYEKENGETISLKHLIGELSKPMAAYLPDIKIVCRRIELTAVFKGEGQGVALSVLFGGFDFGALPVAGPMIADGCGCKELEVYIDTRSGAKILAKLYMGGQDQEVALALGSQASAQADQNTGTGRNVETGQNALTGRNVETEQNALTGRSVETDQNTGTCQNADTECSSNDAAKKWLDIQKGVGPFYISRLGMAYEDGSFFLMLDASLHIKALVFRFYGLSIGSRLDHFSPSARLDGMEVTYDVPPILLSGGIMRVPPSAGVLRQYDGSLSLKVNDWNVSVIASYVEKADGRKCFFAFAQLDKTLGGIPAFTVEGLMGGLGVHYALKAPELAMVDKFPLMQLGTSSLSGMEMLKALEGAWLSPKEGARWLAAGIRFSSFNMLEGKLLLIADFSDSLILTLLGHAQLSLPKGKPRQEAYLYAELSLSAVLNPNAGVCSIQAQLTPASFLIDRNCHLTGGFAFYLWFGSHEHAGDFVFTVGGYHPAFHPPSHYPSASRVGFCWKVGGSVTISGEAYLALTPSCIMAGGKLAVVYERGFVKAWFTAVANLLLSWKPFAFRADVAVEIGVSARINLLFIHKTVTASLGASLDLWGPPTGGKVKIKLWFITFTISFGSQSGVGMSDTPLDWGQFAELLPPQDEVITIQAVDGLNAAQDAKDGKKVQDTKEDVWTVSPQKFCFQIGSAVPLGKIRNGNEILEDFAPVAIRLMNLTGVSSELTVNITNENGRQLSFREDGWQVRKKTGALPTSLWGEPIVAGGSFRLKEDRPTADVAKGQVTGICIAIPPAAMGRCVKSEDTASLLQPAIHRFCPLTDKEVEVGFSFTQGDIGMLEHMGSEQTVWRRKQLFDGFCEALGEFAAGQDDMKQMAAKRGQIFTDAPQIIGDRNGG